VINGVNRLFKGHPSLILGFNTFLPAEYKIVIDDGGQGVAQSMLVGSNLGMGSLGGGDLNGAGGYNLVHVPAEQGGAYLTNYNGGVLGGPMVGMQHSMPGGGAIGGGVLVEPPPVRPGPAYHRPGAAPSDTKEDYNLAVNYVKLVRHRFADDPGVYRKFLAILDAYQRKYKMGTARKTSWEVLQKDVLEKVCRLFEDHPDLLHDFAFFFPETVQMQARVRIERALEAYELRLREGKVGAGGFPAGTEFGRGGLDFSLAAANAAPGGKRSGTAPNPASSSPQEGLPTSERAQTVREREKERERERALERVRERAQIGMGPGKALRTAQVVRKRRGREHEMALSLTANEGAFFETVKAALSHGKSSSSSSSSSHDRVGGVDPWGELLKCLQLFSCEVLTRAELVGVASEVLTGALGAGAAGKLIDELKALLASRAPGDLTSEDTWYSMPIAELDLSGCDRCTPSYRRLPHGFPKATCSERSRMEAEVLNDLWVSVPTGSEDFSFKITRKNDYENALFRVEDERHEVDLVIEANVSTIKLLEPLAEEVRALREATAKGFEWQFRLDRRALGVVHLNAIRRVYGEFGSEMLELLRKNPGDAIPVILKRLQAKDDEWRRARAELNKGWKLVMEKNYKKSLDHRSFYFKQTDKKAQSARTLIGELKGKAEECEADLVEYVSAMKEALEVRNEKAAAAAAAAAATAAAAENTSGGEMMTEEAGNGAVVATPKTPTTTAAAAALEESLDAVNELICASTGVNDLKAIVNALAPATSPLASLASAGFPLPAGLRARVRALEPVWHAQYVVSVPAFAVALLSLSLFLSLSRVCVCVCFT